MGLFRVTVRASWDEDAGVWYVVESNVPGLAVEAKTQKAFERLLRQVVPELVELNGLASEESADDGLAPADLIYQQHREVVIPQIKS